MKWIKVEERLPPDDNCVLVIHTGCSSHYSAPFPIWMAYYDRDMGRDPFKVPEAWKNKNKEKEWVEYCSKYPARPTWRTTWDLGIGKITHWMPLPEPPIDFGPGGDDRKPKEGE